MLIYIITMRTSNQLTFILTIHLECLLRDEPEIEGVCVQSRISASVRQWKSEVMSKISKDVK